MEKNEKKPLSAQENLEASRVLIKSQLYVNFCNKHKDRIKEWTSQHSEHDLIPVYWNGEEWLWVNRKSRRQG